MSKKLPFLFCVVLLFLSVFASRIYAVICLGSYCAFGWTCCEYDAGICIREGCCGAGVCGQACDMRMNCGANALCVYEDYCGACNPSCSAPLCGQDDTCGSPCSSADTTNWSVTATWCDSNCGGATCYTSYSTPCGGSKTEATGSTCNECGPSYGAWGSCSGSPASKSRTLTWDCQAPTSESTSCYGTIQARALRVGSADTSCATVKASTTAVAPTTFTFSPSSPSQPSGTQTDTSYVTFGSALGGTYTLMETPPSDYVLRRACYVKTSEGVTYEGLSATLSVPIDGDTTTWDLGYTLGKAWFQAQGGDVYGATNVQSYAGPSASPRVIVADGAGGYPGIVSYGSSYDFESSVTNAGETVVSATNWLVNETFSTMDFYTTFWRRFGGPTTVDYDNTAASLSQPASRATPYLVSGPLGTQGNWNIPDGEKLIFLVDGNITINGTITTTGTGMAVFITNGNITIASSVGVAPASSTPVVEGMYIANGSFNTGTSSSGVERFVGKGNFVAGSFNLQRDLGDDNASISPELFIWDPKILVHMPQAMMDVPYYWQEVAP